MRKRRILIANDAHWLGTGYAVYGKELLTRLHKTGKYEIAELCCYANKEMCSNVTVPWKLYPNVVSKDQPEELKQRFSSTPTNAFGMWNFDRALIHFKPDIVFDMRDHWMYVFQETNLLRPFYKWVVMPTVDSAPQSKEWLHTFANMDCVIPYTKWAHKTLQSQCRSTINLFPHIANAGVDLDIFKPSEDKKGLKKRLFQNENASITGCVLRNQKRKLIPNILKCYKAYLNRLLEEDNIELYNNSYLYLHTTHPEISGLDLPSLLLEFELLDKTIFTTCCTKCGSTYPSKFHEGKIVCVSCQEFGAILPSVSHPVPTEVLTQIYQSFDLFLQVAICEGFGMPQVEAAACGVPIASVDYSAMSEIVENLEGYKIPLRTMFRELETGADRALPDDVALTGIIYNFFKMSDSEKAEKSTRTRKLCELHYSWDKVAEVWDMALSSVDISDNLSWDIPARTIDATKKVPKGLGVSEFVDFIILELIQEPWLLTTAMVIKIKKDLANGFSTIGERGQVTHQTTISILEKIMLIKSSVESVRTNPIEHFKKTGFDYE